MIDTVLVNHIDDLFHQIIFLQMSSGEIHRDTRNRLSFIQPLADKPTCFFQYIIIKPAHASFPFKLWNKLHRWNQSALMHPTYQRLCTTDFVRIGIDLRLIIDHKFMCLERRKKACNDSLCLHYFILDLCRIKCNRSAALLSGSLICNTCACHNISRCPDIIQLTDTDRRPEYKLFFLDFGPMIQPEILELR